MKTIIYQPVSIKPRMNNKAAPPTLGTQSQTNQESEQANKNPHPKNGYCQGFSPCFSDVSA